MKAMRRTKIVATLGPASTDPAVLEEMIIAGVDVVRLNFSHGDVRSFIPLAKTIYVTANKVGRSIAILADLQGPKIRIARFQEDSVILTKG
ncbi:MAG TPA: pyruvate kinase, partial [Gammaproteobacteria bacterium]|nr:pyruvate kinase [Gammaproteobacteria bacterium]